MFGDLLSSKMNRKEFLGYVSALLLTVTGVSGVMKALKTSHPHYRANGFGSGGYGGAQRSQLSRGRVDALRRA